MPKSMRKRKQGRKRRARSAIGVKFGNNRLPLPPRTTCDFTYNVALNVNNVGAVFANVRYQPTYAYDIDPTLGSTAMPFFTEMGTLYRYYRVLSSRIVVHFSNKENFSTIVYLCAVNFDPTANTSTYQNYLSNPVSRHHVVGPATGNGIGTLQSSQTTNGFSGSKWLGDADPYSARTNGTGGAPANNWYWLVGCRSDGNTFTANNGVFCDITIHIRLCFFEEESPAT